MPDPNPSVLRPTPLAERTLVGVAAGFCLQSLIFGAFLLVPSWPNEVAGDRVHYLGWALLLSAAGNLFMVLAFASPWLGSVKIEGLGAQIDVTGENTPNP